VFAIHFSFLDFQVLYEDVAVMTWF